jgi:hypothetical protein
MGTALSCRGPFLPRFPVVFIHFALFSIHRRPTIWSFWAAAKRAMRCLSGFIWCCY